jgi:hypothetical protein
MNINWEKVAQRLDDLAQNTLQNAFSAFPNDFKTQREMRTRAAPCRMLAEAIRAGLEK